MHQNKPELSLIMVGYNCLDLLASTVEWLLEGARTTGVELEVIVVDNASADGTATQLPARFADRRLRVVANATNVGFAAAVNRGAELAQGKALWILNPDARPTEAKALARAVQLAREMPDTIFGSRIISQHGELYRSARAFPRLDWQLCHALGFFGLFRGSALDTCRLPGLDYQSRQRVDWVSGASLICSAAAFAKIGGFDSTFFLFAEEVDLCRRAGTLGVTVYYDPSITVTHDEGGTRRELADFSWLQSKWGLHQYFSKHHGPGHAGAYAVIACIETALRTVYHVGTGRRRAQAALRLCCATAAMFWRGRGPNPPQCRPAVTGEGELARD